MATAWPPQTPLSFAVRPPQAAGGRRRTMGFVAIQSSFHRDEPGGDVGKHPQADHKVDNAPKAVQRPFAQARVGQDRRAIDGPPSVATAGKQRAVYRREPMVTGAIRSRFAGRDSHQSRPDSVQLIQRGDRFKRLLDRPVTTKFGAAHRAWRLLRLPFGLTAAGRRP
jgi:hypothetical protein